MNKKKKESEGRKIMEWRERDVLREMEKVKGDGRGKREGEGLTVVGWRHEGTGR